MGVVRPLKSLLAVTRGTDDVTKPDAAPQRADRIRGAPPRAPPTLLA